MSLAIIAAVSENRVIGVRGGIPWHLPQDLQRFKALTMGHPIIMGRRTHESIRIKLAGRRNIVVTGNPSFLPAPGCEIASSLEHALLLARNDHMSFVIGGSQLYEEALPLTDVMYITKVHRVISEGDAFFPDFDEALWRKSADGSSNHECSYWRYERKAHELI